MQLKCGKPGAEGHLCPAYTKLLDWSPSLGDSAEGKKIEERCDIQNCERAPVPLSYPK